MSCMVELTIRCDTRDDVTEIWYRYENRNYAPPPDEYGDRYGEGSVAVVLMRFAVSHHTPKGVRLRCGRFVLNESTRRYACPTMELAMESFLARKNRQISIYRSRIRSVERALAQVEGQELRRIAKDEAESDRSFVF